MVRPQGAELLTRRFVHLRAPWCAPEGGAELLTCGLGADDGIRTRDPHLGKVGRQPPDQQKRADRLEILDFVAAV
jgi:hypothetical protein